MKFKRNAALISAAAVIGVLTVGGVVAANASDNGSNAPAGQSTEKGDGDGEVPDSQENEKSDGDGEVPDAQENEGSDGEVNDDATDTGPDANPNEPGHQDASDTAGQ